MATLKQTLKFYLKVLLGSSSIGYAYLYYRCKKLREEAIDEEVINSKKDTTRPSNVYYGLNWGFRSDNTIEKSLDTGDLLYFNYNCMNCFNPSDVIKCYYEQQYLKEDDPQNVAFCFRTPKRLYVITSHFGGIPQIILYHEFLNKPFIKTVKVRQILNQPVNMLENSTQFVAQLREQIKKQEVDKDLFTSMLKTRMMGLLLVNRMNKNLIPHYLAKLQMLRADPFEKPFIQAKELDSAKPDCLFDAYELSNAVMIRTYASQNLVKRNVT
ncbi:UNKNOWN [Stylonychia lemnae]|uniref:Uncharacterized protein n=1 Tax=Stylonychia lemnae TaxID=5949 RepID=A0A078ANW5_STYLE|nr:UNKNOWN [Stylonychia lemnae]|eukprot:CDW82653.1 UNKNOWN [Stylonychia lemnae]